MLNRILPGVTCASLAFVLLSFAALPPAQADGIPPRVDLSTYISSPGERIEVRGVGLPPDAIATVTLTGGGTQIPLGEALVDVEGDFVANYELPADLSGGSYTVQVTAEAVVAESEPLELRPRSDPVYDPAEDHGLLLPLPEVRYVSTEVPPPTPTPVTITGLVQEKPALFGIGALVLIALATGVVMLRRRG